MKRIVCMGGGPAGLYSAILFKKALPGASVEIFERNRPDDTFGWGVVFSDKTMGNFLEADAPSHARIADEFYHWDDIDVHFKGQTVRSGGHGFAGISRRMLLSILQKRAASLGVRQTFQHELDDADEFDGADLVIIAEGANSKARTRQAEKFGPNIEVRKCRYIWLGTTQKFSAFTFAFEKTEFGWFQIHAYQFSKDLSTVIVETREETWAAHGLDKADADQSIAFCEKLFAAYLGIAPLLSNARHLRGSPWLNFHRVECRHWHDGSRVLIGDSAHTAHFSIGSGTKLAMEDAISLVRHVSHALDVRSGLESYQSERSVEAQKLQNAARNRMEWFENVARYENMEPLQFAYSLLSGSQRIGHANLKLRDARFIDKIETDLASKCGGIAQRRPPMFLPFRLRDMQLVNRIVVSPMAQYRAVDGVPSDWHLVHYGARATGGAGLVFTEMTCTSADARISPGCTGRVRALGVPGAHLPAARPRGTQRLDTAGVAGSGSPFSQRQLAVVGALAAAVLGGHQPGAARIDAGADGSREIRFCSCGDARGRGRIRHARIAYGTWLFAGKFPVPLDQSQNGRIRGIGRESNALSAAGAARGARRMAGNKARQCAHISVRLGRRRLERSRRDSHCQGLGGGRCGYSRYFERTDRGDATPGLRPDVADAIGRHGAQPGRRSHHCGGKYLRGRSRQFDHRRGPSGFVRDRAPAPRESLVDARGGGRARLRAAVVARALSPRQEST
jgi:2-polyprenyl-6-methoxyphenol hydroxylase-like FAD-dependent oxidoreductase